MNVELGIIVGNVGKNKIKRITIIVYPLFYFQKP